MRIFITTITLILTTFCFAQSTIPEVLEKLNKKSVPYITVNELQIKNKYVLLDTREIKEFNVSHIKNSINIGYDKFDAQKVTSIVKDKNALIVVYCSIGVRSEKIGENLFKLGYKKVFNLYGGIFEWKNKGGIVVDNKNEITENIHTFSKKWSIYLKKGNQIYEE
ncbi:rhodanese-like domain-containing protein [Flavobacterium soyangense]|uniref:Rhodanese-like domain-containing protein n=2 Tax=Flavobacterium soyangense TaxID=2023265 RepID=A0A930U9V0_9FLAO|nr:rhodanese-like domain-containing protein [Flavobacterium soyangense]